MIVPSPKRTPYVVYVDESFDHFMNLPSLDGNFCYAALMVPEDKISQLNDFWTALEIRVRRLYYEATGDSIAGEVKSRHVRELSGEVRTDIFSRIVYCLTKNNIFVGGFFTTVHALLCYEVRTDIASSDDATEFRYSPSKLEEMKVELATAKKGAVGESHILSRLFQTIAGIPFSWLAHLRGRCSIVYDARDVKEDPATFRVAEDIFPRMKNLGPQFEGVYQGTTSEPSQRTPGLMLVDLICGELRRFMLNNPSLWNDGSSVALITPTSNEGEVVWQPIAGRMCKWGSKKQMSDATLAALATAKREEPFSLLLPALADRKLSCYAQFGEARVIDFSANVFHDMVD